jgi:hypothetical protein
VSILLVSHFSYEPVHANIIRNFQKQNVTREDPQLYLTRYGSQLYDPELVIQQARAVGVVEDLVCVRIWLFSR